jgi:fatty acid desaturase
MLHQTVLRETAPPNILWRDLVPLSRRQTLIELTLPLPWLLTSWVLFASPLWWLGALPSFMFFLCALRLNHEAIHSNLGLSRRGDIAILHLLSALMGGSNCAVAWNHMLHHRHAMGPDDHEGHCGEMTVWQVLRYGPRFPVDLNRAAWANGGRKWRLRIVLDWCGIVALFVFALWLGQRFLLLHLAAVAIAQCLTAFFAVWITHQGTTHSGLAARSQRGVLAKVAYLMFYHREHHLFPKVPVAHLPDLAARLDSGVAGYAENRMPVVPCLDTQKPPAVSSC